MGEMQAMAVAVSALVSMAGGESKLERDAGFTCAKLCDPVTRRRGAGLGQSGDLCWWAVGPPSGIRVSDLGVRARADAGLLPGAAALAVGSSTVTLKKTARIRRRVCSYPFQKISNNLYCGEGLESLFMRVRVDIIPAPNADS